MKIVDLEGPLHLTNDGQLELVFLGTGTAFGHRLYQTNFVLIKGDTHILVDFGMTGPQALRAVGRQAEDISVVLPTHSHADHIGGLEFLSLKNRYFAIPSGRPKLTMITTEEYRSILWDQSLRGGLEYNELNPEGRRLDFSDFYDVHLADRINNGGRSLFSTEFRGIKLELFHTNHIPDQADSPEEAFITYGLFVDDRLFISGDTKFDAELIDTYKDRSEAMFHDASVTKNAVHASLSELATLDESVLKKMYLMHYQDDMTEEVASAFAGLAHQGKRYIFE